MASPDLTARLRYLNDSAHLLAMTAPSTSKHLMSQCNALMFADGIDPPDSHKRKACGACGTIMVLGWDGKLEMQPKRGRRGKSGTSVTDRARAMVYECGSCGRKTRFYTSTAQSSVSKHSSAPGLHMKHLTSSTQVSDASQSELFKPKSRSNTIATSISTSTLSGDSSKRKRTKSRKQSGLEAVLARQKATDSRGSSGFDLLDFMKKA
ncbi:hypothetical protein D0Z07_8053 [Hyphodiscus hymeniophilus]|uniref:Uncharacterized protein n=1 Tax=Hyphodiscus hymeniophilus TaxID=353542 RepID=A0A9P6VE76_9HELO|nr:hypothetical protein D0Z07_8053 [Hyphodiscus hymeniophilus]